LTSEEAEFSDWIRDVSSGLVLIMPRDEDERESTYAMRLSACSFELVNLDCVRSLRTCVKALDLSLEFAACWSALCNLEETMFGSLSQGCWQLALLVITAIQSLTRDEGSLQRFSFKEGR